MDGFTPGERLTVLEAKTGRNEPMSSRVDVLVPARLHLSVIDMNRFTVGRFGGGGIGMSADIKIKISVSTSPTETIQATSEREAVVRHIAEAFRRSIGYTGGLQIAATSSHYKHVGLGSTSSTLIGTAYALNHLFGEPLSLRQLRELVAYNFVEEDSAGLLHEGFETGVGPAAILFGGFIVLTDEIQLIRRATIPEKYDVVIAIPKTKVSATEETAGEGEKALLLGEGRRLDQEHAGVKSHTILMDLIPRLSRGDWRGVGNAMSKIQRIGSKRAEIEYHTDTPIYEILDRLEQEGSLVAGMSSVGPTIACICKGDRVDSCIDVLSAYVPKERIIETKPENKGITSEAEDSSLKERAATWHSLDTF
ncbi:MAG: GHMP family kinase ATP-binding protein [Halobacteriota archaeon]